MGFSIPLISLSWSGLTSVESWVLVELGLWVFDGDESRDLRFLVGEEEELFFFAAKRRALDMRASKAEGREDMLE